MRKKINKRRNQMKCYKMTEKEIFNKGDNLNEDELNTKSNKSVYVKNTRGEKKTL